MLTTTFSKPNTAFRQQVLTVLNQGIRHHDRFEDLSSEILNDISLRLIMIDDYNLRKAKLNAFKRQIEEAQKIRRYNMMYESPGYNKQFSAALTHLLSQFKLRFSRYII